MADVAKRWIPLLSWFATGSVALLALWSIDQPRFDLPPLEPSLWSQWAATRDPLDAVAGVSRLVASGAIVYLLVMSVAYLVALLWGHHRSRRFTARLMPGPVAAILATAVLGSSPFAGAAGANAVGSGYGAGRDDPPPPVMRVVGDDQSPTTSTGTSPMRPTGTSTTSATSTTRPTSATSTTRPTSSTSTTRPAPTSSTRPTVAVRPGSTSRIGPEPKPGVSTDRSRADQGTAPDPFNYTVAQGDNLWLIAARRIRLGLGRDGTDDEVRGYWLALMDLNADRLVQPGNPNLLRPGQDLILPG